MLEKMKQQVTNMWKSLTSAEETEASKKQLISREEIPGTPIIVAGNKDTGYFLALGRYRLTETMDTKEGAVMLLELETWNVISRLIAAYIDFEKQIATFEKHNAEQLTTTENN